MSAAEEEVSNFVKHASSASGEEVFSVLKGLLDLLEPYFHPIVDDLLDDVEACRTWRLADVPEAIVKMNSSILDVAHLIPPSFYQVVFFPFLLLSSHGLQ